MRAFHFPLRQTLNWRQRQLEMEENQLRQLVSSREEMALAAVRLDLARGRAEQAVLDLPAVEAANLWALAAYRGRLIAEREALLRRREACERQIAVQQRKVVETQRQCRLLEKLEERRRAEWRREAEREVENLAAESFLALWNRQAAHSQREAPSGAQPAARD